MKRKFLIAAIALQSLPLYAEYDYFRPLYESSDKSFRADLGNLAGLGFFKLDHAAYGAGSIDTEDSTRVKQNPGWWEGFLSSKIKVQKNLANTTQVYGAISAIGTFTQGNGEPSTTSTTSNRPSWLDTEDMMLGWKSGKLFDKNEHLIDFSFGNQSLQIGDAFVIGDGTTDSGRRAAFYLGPRTAFRHTAILKINKNPYQVQLFNLVTNTNQRIMKGVDQPKAHMAGFNVDYTYKSPTDDKKDLWTLGLMYLNIYKADNTPNGTVHQNNRNGLNVINPRMGGFFFPFDRDLRFYAGYVSQFNNSDTRKATASAYYLEPGYVFSKVWATPLVTYRYTHLSGDSTPGVGRKKSYDPLGNASGVRDGMGTWELGQIYGQYYGANSNSDVHSFQLKMTPMDRLTVGAWYYFINFDKTQQAHSTSKRGVEEFNLYATYDYDWVVFTGLFGVSMPKAGMKQALLSQNSSLKANNVGKNAVLGGLTITFRM